jgi:hypothetical protein
MEDAYVRVLQDNRLIVRKFYFSCFHGNTNSRIFRNLITVFYTKEKKIVKKNKMNDTVC